MSQHGPIIVLASASPRRIDLLTDLLGPQGFTVEPADIDEAAVASSVVGASAAVTAVARAKAAARWRAGVTVVAADTVVVHDDKTLGKPRDRDAARATLQSMRGDRVQIVSAVVVMGPRGARTDEVTQTDVWVGHPSDDEIDRYVASGAADDKAGGLAIQDDAAPFIEAVRGCRTNVYGLALCATIRLLQQFSHPVNGTCPQCGDEGGNEAIASPQA